MAGAVPMAPPPVLISEAAIAARVDELARQVSRDYGDKGEVVLVGVLRGAFILLADLARRLTIPCQVAFVALSSYQGWSATASTTTTGSARCRISG